jgi:hypothetical protein
MPDLQHKFSLLIELQRKQCSPKLLPQTVGLNDYVSFYSQRIRNAVLTIQNRSVGCQESILQRLLNIALLESFLLCDDLVYIFAREYRHSIASMSIINSEE